MAVLLSLRMDRIEVVDDEDEHPRNPVNIHNYLVDETFPDYDGGSASNGSTNSTNDVSEDEDEDNDLSVPEQKVSTATAQVLQDDAKNGEDRVSIENKNNSSSVLVNKLKRAHSTGLWRWGS